MFLFFPSLSYFLYAIPVVPPYVILVVPPAAFLTYPLPTEALCLLVISTQCAHHWSLAAYATTIT